ncbi:mitofusin [Elasticomyces elasticus]|nr:mitofusin [Elasticomyces elasticus]
MDRGYSPAGYASPSGGSSRRPHGGPGYMTVGSGSTSESAARLAAMLDEDSGYGGSVYDDGVIDRGWNPGMTEDRYTPAHTPLRPGESNAASENEKRALASHVHQLFYNQNRTALGRAINQTVEILKKLQEVNAKWPAHYPTVQRPRSPSPVRLEPRPGLQHTQSTLNSHHEQHRPLRPMAPRRAATSLGEDKSEAESSAAALKAPSLEPRLVTPQLAQQFSVLKIELKMEGVHQTELVHSLEKQSIASLLDGQISSGIRHLFALRERIEDTSSKVLVTGDLNAGKSTFCNALLRRKVLPEDQQPCTSIFCEVLDVRENGGVEEVHAVPINSVYDRNDESSYEVFGLEDLEKIVTDNERYSQCKIYIKDIRSVDESLLNNGVVDIALIDAPGLNNDSLKTTAVFARQEEIDVVVFVVSAANHFTLSAKEFIFNAAREKAYIFMVVNGFDNIRDKKRCQEMILKQVAHLSPATFKESSELVHFVSSNAIPVAPAGSLGNNGGGGGGGSSSFGGGDDYPDNDDDGPSGKHGEPGSPPIDKGKGKEKEKLDDFNELEAALRRFVLEKRARSKLAPAKTYLLNLLGDLHSLASVNKDVAQNELDRVTKEMQELEPIFEQSKKARTEAGEGVDLTIEDTAARVYSHTRETLNTSIALVAERDLGVRYPGLLSAYHYADDLKAAMLEEISRTVRSCEEHAREQTVHGVSGIKSLGLLHLGDQYVDLTFRSDRMFRSRRDALARQVDIEVELWDFVDIGSLWERQEKVAGTSMAVTVAGVVGGRMIGGVGWLDGALGAAKIMSSKNIRKLIIPGLILTAALGISYALTSIPSSLPRRLSTKLATQLNAIDYTHSNAARISAEVRRALKFPADKLRDGLQRGVERLEAKRAETGKVRAESEVARKYFGNLFREAADVKGRVDRVDLEGPAPGVAAQFPA